MKLKDLVGIRVIDARGQYVATATDRFHDNARVELYRIDGVVYAFAEDANDGYRSMLGDVRTATSNDFSQTKLVPFEPLVCNLFMYQRPSLFLGDRRKDEVLVAVSERTGLVVLEIGTTDIQDYYPSFIARWDPAGHELSEAIIG